MTQNLVESACVRGTGKPWRLCGIPASTSDNESQDLRLHVVEVGIAVQRSIHGLSIRRTPPTALPDKDGSGSNDCCWDVGVSA